MKHNSVILFRGPFGQLIQDNVEGPEEHLVFRLVGNGRARTVDTTGKREKKINSNVAKWRLDSLRGIVGVVCPCLKYIAPLVDNEEFSLMEATGDEYLRFYERRMEAAFPVLYQRQPSIPEFFSSQARAFAMLGGYRPDRHFAYSPECVLIPGAHVWTEAQSFSMLGGYRIDRHPSPRFPWGYLADNP